MDNPTDVPILHCESPEEWETWLDAQHAQSNGVWLQIAKKGAAMRSPSYAEALDVALCYGWIDGQKRGYDDASFLQRFTPRRARSIWSLVNTAKAEALIAAGRMNAAGLREVEAAKRDGRWDAAYASHSTMTIPEDFQAALDAEPEAQAFFAQLDKTNRYAIYFRIQTAKKPETCKARIEKFIAMLAEHKKIHP